MARPAKAQIKTSDAEPPMATTVEMASTCKVVERPDLAVVVDDTLASPHIAEYVSDLKFMEDILTVSVAETNDKNAENPVPCGVNGEIRWLDRGKDYKLARKFVDSLIKREDRIETENYSDDKGVDQTRVKKIPSLKYPLSILHDPAGDTGRRWFLHQSKNAW